MKLNIPYPPKTVLWMGFPSGQPGSAAASWGLAGIPSQSQARKRWLDLHPHLLKVFVLVYFHFHTISGN